MTSQRGLDATPLLIMHIPKTAGTSLLSIVQQQYAPEDLEMLYPCTDEQIDALVARPRPPRVVMGHFQFGLHERLSPGCRYVTFLRDPVEQVVSHFNYLAASTAPDHLSQLGPNDTLEDFIDHPWAMNLQTQFLCRRSPIEIYADPEDAFRHALAVIDRHFVAVGTVEWFLESIIAMTPMLGWRAVPVPALNAAPRGPRSVRRSELDPDLVRGIEQRNQTDRRLHDTMSRRLWREIAARRT